MRAVLTIFNINLHPHRPGAMRRSPCGSLILNMFLESWTFPTSTRVFSTIDPSVVFRCLFILLFCNIFVEFCIWKSLKREFILKVWTYNYLCSFKLILLSNDSFQGDGLIQCFFSQVLIHHICTYNVLTILTIWPWKEPSNLKHKHVLWNSFDQMSPDINWMMSHKNITMDIWCWILKPSAFMWEQEAQEAASEPRTAPWGQRSRITWWLLLKGRL